MSQASPEPGAHPAGKAGGKVGGGKPILGMPPLVFYGLLGLSVALLWYMRKSRKAASAASGTQGASTGSCTDANGNPVPCTELAGVDYSGQLSVLQTEIEALLAQQSSQGTAAPAAPAAPGPAPGATATAGGGTATATTASTQAQKYNAPTGLRVSKVNASTAQITWSLGGQPAPQPSSYTVAVYQLNGKLISQQTVSVPDQTGGTSGATVSGLHQGWTYQIHVWANGGRQAPPHASAMLRM